MFRGGASGHAPPLHERRLNFGLQNLPSGHSPYPVPRNSEWHRSINQKMPELWIDFSERGHMDGREGLDHRSVSWHDGFSGNGKGSMHCTSTTAATRQVMFVGYAEFDMDGRHQKAGEIDRAMTFVAQQKYPCSRPATLDEYNEGATGVADYFFNNRSYDTWAAMNLETNYGDHTVKRMLGEAQDLNMHFSYPDSRLLGRTASFCMERSGYNEGGLNDQGLIFFLPNMTWLQPPGHVHAMITDTWQPLLQNFNLSGDCGSLATEGSISVQASEDRKTMVLRVVNSSPNKHHLTININHNEVDLTWRSLASTDLFGANTPACPFQIAPVEQTPIKAGTSIDLLGQSYNVFVARDRATGENSIPALEFFV